MSSTPRRWNRCAEEYMHNINTGTYPVRMSNNKPTPERFVVGRPNTKLELPIALPDEVARQKIIDDPVFPSKLPEPPPPPKVHESHPSPPALPLPMQAIRKATGEEDLLMAGKDHGKLVAEEFPFMIKAKKPAPWEKKDIIIEPVPPPSSLTLPPPEQNPKTKHDTPTSREEIIDKILSPDPFEQIRKWKEERRKALLA